MVKEENMNNVKAIKWENDSLVLIDCTKLPIKEEYIICKEYATLIDAINCLAVRGAPAIGIAAAYGVVLAAQEAREKADSKASYLGYINEAIQKLAATRPTAVNLFWALDRVKEVLDKVSEASEEAIRDRLLKEAETMYAEDIACNMKIKLISKKLLNWQLMHISFKDVNPESPIFFIL
jgi:methylthioribose-1-phosphate isomerase